MKPICHKCHRFFKMRKSGYAFTEGMPSGNSRAPAGRAQPEAWRPYKIWSGDLWECPECGATIISGTGLAPMAIQHQEGFEKLRQQTNATQFQVNDC